MTKDAIREVLDFWFDEASEPHWFKPSAAFDEAVRQRLARLQMRAAAGELDDWRASAEGCVALCILLDQAPRQLFRGSSRAFATNESALAIAERALANGFERQLPLASAAAVPLSAVHAQRTPRVPASLRRAV